MSMNFYVGRTRFNTSETLIAGHIKGETWVWHLKIEGRCLFLNLIDDKERRWYVGMIGTRPDNKGTLVLTGGSRFKDEHSDEVRNSRILVQSIWTGDTSKLRFEDLGEDTSDQRPAPQRAEPVKQEPRPLSYDELLQRISALGNEQCVQLKKDLTKLIKAKKAKKDEPEILPNGETAPF